MNFSFIWKTSLQIQDIWKDGKFSKWLLSPLDQNTFQELVFKAVKNRKRSGSSIASRSERLHEICFFSKIKLCFLRRWWQLWMKSTRMKQRYRIIYFPVMFRLTVLLLNSMSKLIQNRCTCKFIIMKLYGYIRACMQANNCVFVLIF